MRLRDAVKELAGLREGDSLTSRQAAAVFSLVKAAKMLDRLGPSIRQVADAIAPHGVHLNQDSLFDSDG